MKTGNEPIKHDCRNLAENIMVLQKEDFTAYALDIGIWEGLTGGDDSIQTVDVRVIRRDK